MRIINLMDAPMKIICLDQSKDVGVAWDALKGFPKQEIIQKDICLVMKDSSILIDWGVISGPNDLYYNIFYRLGLLCELQTVFY
jgi:hypothetical protein